MLKFLMASVLISVTLVLSATECCHHLTCWAPPLPRPGTSWWASWRGWCAGPSGLSAHSSWPSPNPRTSQWSCTRPCWRRQVARLHQVYFFTIIMTWLYQVYFYILPQKFLNLNNNVKSSIKGFYLSFGAWTLNKTSSNYSQGSIEKKNSS